MKKNTKYCKIKKLAFSLAEMLIVMLILSVIILAASALFLHKHNKEVEKLSIHGLLACTMFDNQEYYYYMSNLETKSAASNLKIPTDKSAWTLGTCSSAYANAKKGEILSVTVVGGGGAGGKAKVTWDDNSGKADFSHNNYLSTETYTYTAPKTGYYDIWTYGSRGTTATAGIWTYQGYQYTTKNASAQPSVLYKTRYYLYSNGTLTVTFYPAKQTDYNCRSTSYDIDKNPQTYSSITGGKIIVSSSGTTVSRVYGASGGTYGCNPSQYNSNLLSPTIYNSANLPYTYSYDYRLESPTAISVDSEAWGRVLIFPEDSGATPTVTVGKGGSGGSINSTLWPVFFNYMPSYQIGKGGTPATSTTEAIEPTATKFKSLVGAAGKNDTNNTDSTRPSDNRYGYIGGISLLKYFSNPVGGNRGTPTVLNGGNGLFFGAGGGGGAVSYYYPTNPSQISLGYGGNGANGIIIFTW